MHLNCIGENAQPVKQQMPKVKVSASDELHVSKPPSHLHALTGLLSLHHVYVDVHCFHGRMPYLQSPHEQVLEPEVL